MLCLPDAIGVRLVAPGHDDAVVSLLLPFVVAIVAPLHLLENASANDEEEELREVTVLVVVPRCVIVTAAVALA